MNDFTPVAGLIGGALIGTSAVVLLACSGRLAGISNIAHGDEQAWKLTLSTGDRSYFVPPADVMHCSADDNYTELHLNDGRRFVSARTLKEYEEMLEPWGFLRVHRSSLVNRAAVSHLDDSHLVLKSGARVEVSRRKREEVMRALAS